MESLKKKRPEVKADGRISGKKIRSKKDSNNDEVAAEDAELEEFLAILKRLQAGFDHFRGKTAVTPPAPDAGSWNLAFELDDFKQVQDGGLKINTGETKHNDTFVGFDLNADPVSD